MEQDDSISFSSVVAALLLLSRKITSVEIVNFLSKLSCEGIEVNDKNDDIDDLSICVMAKANYCYDLLDELSYETVLYGNITVHNFLYSHVDKRVLNIIQNDIDYSSLYSSNCPKDMIMETNFNVGLSSNDQRGVNKFSLLKKVKRLEKRIPFYSFFGCGSAK